MAAFEDGSTIPRKRITTYGKANRRRIPDLSFAAVSQKAQTSGAITPQYEETADSKDASTTNGEVIPSQRNLKAETGSQSADVNMLSSGEDTALARPKLKSITKKETSKASQKASQVGVKGNLRGPKKVISTPRSPVSQISSSPSSPPTSTDIYDMPSSEDEPTPKPVKRTIQRINQRSTQPNNSKVGNRITTQLVDLPEETHGNKRRRLSPKQPIQVAQPAKKVIPENTPVTKRVIPELPQTQIELPKIHPIRMATRPKIQARKTKPEPIEPPKAASASKNVLSSNSPSPGPTNTVDGGNSANYISPKATKTWRGFLDSTGEEDSDTVMGNMDGYSKSPQKHVSISPPPVLSRTLSKPAGISKKPQQPVRRMPRRRLIDTLVEQAPEEESSEEDETSASSDEGEIVRKPEEPAKMSHDEFAKILSQTLGQDPTLSPVIMPASQSSQGVGPRVTYSRQRSMLAESDLMSQLALDMPMQHTDGSQHEKPRRGVISPLKKLTNFNEDEEMGDQTPAVTSVHELRQAGANQRFMEEVEDLLDRIGKPVSPSSSMRRSGLSELASKMKDKTFLRQFRDNGIEQRLFLHLGLEQDVVAGFYMISLLMVVLLDANMPHVVAHLRRHGVTRLLIRLVGTPQSALKLGKERKSNMSKMALALLTEHHDSLLRLPVWGQLEPQLLSPRTVALKCLELMVRQTREAGKSDDIFSKEMTTLLFDTLKSASDESSWALPKDQQAIDFFLALSILELHSIKAMTAHDESIWISEYLPIVADTVEMSLRRSAEHAGELQYMLLRLIVNVTNNDPKASDVFAKPGVMNSLGQAIITKFAVISRFMTEEDLTEAVAQLVVSLGVMINLSESPAARKCFNSLRGNPDDPLAKMVDLFIGNQENMAEANTQEESQRNVPFGYLSILLGYMCLDPAISERIQQRLPGRTLRPLLSSIEQFISYHKAVDDMLEAEEDGYSRQTGLTERLESLVQRLVTI